MNNIVGVDPWPGGWAGRGAEAATDRRQRQEEAGDRLQGKQSGLPRALLSKYYFCYII